MRRNESGNAFMMILALLIVFIFVPIAFMATGTRSPIDIMISFFLSILFYGFFAILFLAIIGLFLWVFRLAFSDLLQSFGQKLGIDPRALANEYKALFMEECEPFFQKCEEIISPYKERFFPRKQNSSEDDLPEE